MFTWPLNDGEGHLTETQSFLHITEFEVTIVLPLEVS